MNLIQALAHAIRLPELRNKILFTGGVLVIFRLFANIAVRFLGSCDHPSA